MEILMFSMYQLEQEHLYSWLLFQWGHTIKLNKPASYHVVSTVTINESIIKTFWCMGVPLSLWHIFATAQNNITN